MKKRKSNRKSLVNKLDRLFSEYIRKRDTKDGMFICVSCGRTLPYEEADAGHFINRKWMPTRWDETNVHAQCRRCNRFDEGNIPEYYKFMINKYGEDHVNELLKRKTSGEKISNIELERLIGYYGDMLDG